MRRDKIFKYESGEKTEFFISLLEEGEKKLAVRYFQENPVRYKNLLAILCNIYTLMGPSIFCSFMSEALAVMHEPRLTAALVNLLKQDIRYFKKLGDVAHTKLISSLLSHGDSHELKALFTHPYITTCFDKFYFFQQNELTELLVQAVLVYPEFSILFMKIAIEQMNVMLIKKICEVDAELKINVLGEEEKNIASILLSIDDQDEYDIGRLMNQFSRQTFGKIELDGGLFTCAQIASRKKYRFNPTVLSGLFNVKDYLMTLKNTSPPHRERFICSGVHWISGDIQISSDGHVSILFLDPLGLTKLYNYGIDFVILEFARFFPEAVLYAPVLKKQNTLKGCSVFSLVDVGDFYTLENYLEAKFKQSGLHGYLAESAKELVKRNDVERLEIIDQANHKSYFVTPCDLPLTLVRNMQSEKLLTKVIPNRSIEEKEVPILAQKIKKLPTVEYARTMFFASPKIGLPPQNKFLIDKLDKMLKYNLLFLKKVPDSKSIEAVTRPFTVEGFRARKKTPA